MRYNFDEPLNRRRSGSLKWDTYPEDVLPLWVADMDFRCPEEVITALRGVVEGGVFGYPEALHALPHEHVEMRQLLVERMQRRYGWHIQPEDILFVPGVVVGFNLATQAVARPGGEMVVQTPVYPPILNAAGYAGLKRVDVELLPQPACQDCNEISYEIDFDAFEKAFSSQTDVFLLCNPQNPTGRVFSRAELTHLADICLRRGVVIISDEIHNDLIYPPHQHIPIASLDPEIADRTITLMAPSKTYNIPGLQFSFAIVPNRELRRRMVDAMRGLVGWINLMAWPAARAAYEHGDDWLAEVLVYLRENRDYTVSWLKDHLPAVRFTVPQGTYLMWQDWRGAKLELNPYEFLLNNARVALNDGKAFGAGGEGFVRLNFACPRRILQEALERIGRAVEKG